MRTGSRLGAASILLLIAAGWLTAGCGGPTSAQELEVTYYYLPG